jgi:hypothetical protein
MVVEVAATRRRFTRKEYYRMAEVGILGERDRVELIRDEIVERAPIGRRHATGRPRCASTPRPASRSTCVLPARQPSATP